MQHLDRSSKLNICASTTLSNEDIYSLSLLYQPLIGSDALALYLAFSSLIERNNMMSLDFTHDEILKMINMDEKRFLNARIRLEGAALLNTYYANEEFVYILCQPQSPHSFVKNGVLGLCLENIVGDTFEKIFAHFKIKKIDKKKYKNISQTFEDVYKIEPKENKIEAKDNYIVGRKNSRVNINHSFDYDSFYKEIDKSFLDESNLPSFKDDILNISSLYDFSVTDMISLYNQSINSALKFSLTILKRKAKMLYNFKNVGDTTVTSKSDDEKYEFISNLNPTSILKMYNNGVAPSTSDIDKIDEIYSTIPINRAMQNIMIIDVLDLKKGKLPPVSYFEATYNTWVEKGIDTTDKAYKFVFEKKNNGGAQGKVETKTKEPDWMADYLKDLGKGFNK